MNKLLKKLALVMFAVIGLVNLASCGEYNFYKDWSEAGANIESENIFEVLTLEEAKNKIANEEENTFILVVGTSQSSVAASSIETLQAQAEYLDYEGTIYFVDSTDYIEKRKTRAELCEALKIAEITENMKLAAAKALAEHIKENELSEENIIPSALDKSIAFEVAKAVKIQAELDGIVRN